MKFLCTKKHSSFNCIVYDTAIDSVTSIGRSAFHGCTGLTSVTIPGSLTSIGESAFYDCTGLTSVSIPSSVTSIGDLAFHGCTGLTEIQVDGNNADYTSRDGALFNKDVTELILYPVGNLRTAYTIPDSVISIGYGAFEHCTGLTSVTIPGGLTSIGESAFYNCTGLTSVSIPDSVASIGRSAFSNCTGLTNVTIPESVTSIDECTFSGCTGLTSVTIPDSVTIIGMEAFLGCTGLTSVSIPSSITSIGWCAFDGCSGLKDVYYMGGEEDWLAIYIYDYNNYLTNANIHYNSAGPNTPPTEEIPNGLEYEVYDDYVKITGYSGAATKLTIPNKIKGKPVTEIGYAFYDCHDLTSISIGSNVTKISECAFFYCSGLTEINIDDNNGYYKSQDGVLFNKSMTELIQYPAGNERTTYTIPYGVTKINDAGIMYGWGDGEVYGTFVDCDNLRCIIIPNTVTYIGDSAFTFSDNLYDVVIPDSVEYIGMSAFLGTAIYRDTSNYVNEVLYIGNHLIDVDSQISGWYYVRPGTKTIAGGAFEYCSELTGVTIPYSVTSIGNSAFGLCDGLTSITIPSSVMSIGAWAFECCDNLNDVYYSGSKYDWNNIEIQEGNDFLLNATIHYNSTGPAPEIKDPEVKPDEATGGINVTVETENVPETAELVTVAFGADGKVVDIAAVENGEATLNAENVNTVKVFCWESLESMRPLCPAKEVAVAR